MDPRHKIVIDALASGLTYREAGAPIGVSGERSRQIAKLHQVKSRRAETYPLSEEAFTKAASLHKRGMPFRHIAEIVGRNNNVVRNTLARAGLHQAKPGASRSSWSKRDAAILKRLLRTHTFAAAAKEMGRSLGSVLGKAHRMGLCAANDFSNRDENGWRVPREGSKQRRIYDLMRAGIGYSKIVETTGSTRGTVSSAMHHIRHPDKQLHWQAVCRKLKAERAL